MEARDIEIAIKQIKGVHRILMQSHVSVEHCMEYMESARIAVGAMKKQILMKPNSKYDFRYNCNVCPACETEHKCRMLFPGEKFCPDCGQAIDWSEG